MCISISIGTILVEVKSTTVGAETVCISISIDTELVEVFFLSYFLL